MSDVQCAQLTGQEVREEDRFHNKVLEEIPYRRAVSKAGIPISWYTSLSQVPPGINLLWYYSSDPKLAIPLGWVQIDPQMWMGQKDPSPIAPRSCSVIFFFFFFFFGGGGGGRGVLAMDNFFLTCIHIHVGLQYDFCSCVDDSEISYQTVQLIPFFHEIMQDL